MLKTIPDIISPELMKDMMEMGHSDFLVIADANFPAVSNAKRYIKLDGVEIPELLDAVLRYYPLDPYVGHSVRLMDFLPDEPKPEIWQTYDAILKKHASKEEYKGFELLERLAFYQEAQKAYVIVQTATTERYANIMLQKGVI